MNIAQFITYISKGGAEKVGFDLACHFKNKGHNVIIILQEYEELNEKNKIFFDRLNLKGIQVFKLNRKLGTVSIKLFRDLINIINQNDIDIIHSHNPLSSLFVEIIRLFCRNQFIHLMTIHGLPGEGQPIIYRKLFRKFGKRVDAEVFVSNITKYSFPKLSKLSEVIYNGINLDIYRRFDQVKYYEYKERLNILKDDILFISVANLIDHKNHELLIKTFNLLINRDEKRNCKLFIVGDGPLKDRLKYIINYFNLEKNIFLLGERLDVFNLLNSSDYYIQTSKSTVETFGLSVLEACANGLPCILSPCTAFLEVFINMPYCYFSNTYSEDDLLKAIYKCLNNEIDRNKLINKRNDMLNYYDLNISLSKYDLLYNDMYKNNNKL